LGQNILFYARCVSWRVGVPLLLLLLVALVVAVFLKNGAEFERSFWSSAAFDPHWKSRKSKNGNRKQCQAQRGCERAVIYLCVT
jgi:hypothetical protein